MKLENKSHSVKLLRLRDGTELLFSYETPVAGFDPISGYFRTEAFYSSTTTGHINAYIRKDVSCRKVDSEWIETLICRRLDT